ncbi:MAG: agmatinase [Bacteroidetes bacterium]|nr:MAG: agmatinase [Bacteroidota bacterium]
MIKLLGIPYDANSSFLRGAALAPPRIRLMERDGSANIFSENGLAVQEGEIYQDLGDMFFEGANPEAAYHAIKKRVTTEIASGEKLLCLGGDHSIAYPIIEAHAEKYAGLNVLQLDAHGDLYHNFDGNPYSHASPFARLMEKGVVNSLTQVGIRTLTTHQKEQAKKFHVKVYEMKDFNFDFLRELEGPLYISLDLDVLDPAFAPGVSHHEPGGMSTRQLIQIIQSIPVPVIGADIVEYNPTRDVHNVTAMVGYKLFRELVGKMVE